MVLGDILGDMPMESSDDDLEMPDSHQLASSPVLTELDSRRVPPHLSSSSLSSAPTILDVLRPSRPSQPTTPHTEDGHMRVVEEMSSPTAQVMTGSQIQSHAWSVTGLRVPVLQQHSVGAAGGGATPRVCENSTVGQDCDRGDAGGGNPRPADTSSVSYVDCVQEVALDLVTERETPGGSAKPT
jgi:hypothetical protein